MDEIPASEFDGRDFDAREVVQRYRKRVPLPQLQKGLRAHHAATRQELVELINEKYADFVSLSSRMQGVERALKPLRAPLEESSEMMQGLRSKLGAILGQADEAHASLAQVRARKDALTTYIENARILETAKAQAGRKGAQEHRDALAEHASWEGVARDLRRIRLNLGGEAKASEEVAEAPAPQPIEASPECQALVKEVADFEEQFAAQVRERLLALVAGARRRWEVAANAAESVSKAAPNSALARGDLLAMAHLCRALVAVGRAEVAEGVFAEVFTQEVLEKAAADCAAAAEEAQRKPTAGGASPGGGLTLSIGAGAVNLGPFFAGVRTALLAEGTPLLWLARQFGGAWPEEKGAEAQSSLLTVPSLALVANAVATQALQYVQRVWPNTFMPAFPDVFAANYGHSSAFVKAAQAQMHTTERRSFANGVALQEFQRRWKTQVYSSLRKKETEQRLEAAAAVSRAGETLAAEPAHQAAGCRFWLRVSAELVAILEAIWSDRWYLEVLFPKMVHTSLELLARYARMMQTLVDGLKADASGWDSSASPPSWLPGSAPMRLSRVAADALSVVAELQCGQGGAEGGLVARMLLARTPCGGGDRPQQVVRELLHSAREGMQPTMEALQAAVVQHVSAAASPEFAAIRGIPAFYRMLNKPVPKKATPYVESAMRPIHALREAAGGAAPACAIAGWTREAVDAAAGEFAAQAAQLLESTQQQEASLRRLGNRGAGGESQVSDLDKIHIQLCLDAVNFAASAAELGAGPEFCPGLRRLQEVVQPLMALYEAHKPTDA